jgi:hypothetical protein
MWLCSKYFDLFFQKIPVIDNYPSEITDWDIDGRKYSHCYTDNSKSQVSDLLYKIPHGRCNGYNDGPYAASH